MEQRRYQKGCYRCTDQGLPEPVGILPTAAELSEAMQTAQTCKRDGFGKDLQSLDVCTGHANGLQTTDHANAQTATQTAIPLKGKEKSQSFARLHDDGPEPGSFEPEFDGLHDMPEGLRRYRPEVEHEADHQEGDGDPFASLKRRGTA
jgi:hypothetical protein